MIRAIIFDLSEVLIPGLVGVEQVLSPRLSLPPEAILSALGGDPLYELCRGELTENEYLACILQREKWNVSENEFKQIIRRNFDSRVTGMDEILEKLSVQYEFFLLSDHAREWVEYIQVQHPFLEVFKARFFSYELQQMKKDPSTFAKLLQLIEHGPEECLLIDDSPLNITSANSLGVQGICFENAAQLANRLAAMNLL